MLKNFTLTFHYFVSRFSGCSASVFLGFVAVPFWNFFEAWVPLQTAPVLASAGGRAVLLRRGGQSSSDQLCQNLPV